MSLGHGASVVRNGLVLQLDAANRKSYQGSGSAWNDVSGNNQNLVLYNSPIYSSANSGEIRFSNGNDYARITNSSVLDAVGTNGTLDLWFRTMNGTLQTSSNYGRLISIANATGTGSDSSSTQGTNIDYSNFLCLARNDYTQTLALWYKNGSSGPGGFGPSTITVNSDIYINVVIKMETISTTMRFSLYYNGVLVTGPTIYNNTPYSGATTLTLGMNSMGALGNTMENSNIAIGSFRAYSRPLSDQEISQNFNAQRWRYGV